jgi:hypothetical protein
MDEKKTPTEKQLEDAIDTYNRKHGTNVTSVKELLQDCYTRQGESIKNMCEDLCYCWEALKRLMVKHEIPYYPKGGNPKRREIFGPLLDDIPDEEFKRMTAKELSDKVGCVPSTIHHYCKRTGRVKK